MVEREAGGEEAQNKALLITMCSRQLEGKGAPEKEPDLAEGSDNVENTA